jgi:hypothetical protein
VEVYHYALHKHFYSLRKFICLRIRKQHFAVKDATAIRDALVDGKTGTFLEDHVLLLTDTAPYKPTRLNILENLAVLENLIKPEDTLLIFFSGHGYPKEQEVYLLPQDARLAILQDTAIPLTVWKERIAQIPAQTKVIILDACHSGGVEKGKGGSGEMPSQLEQLIDSSVGQATLSSSKRGQTSYEDKEYPWGDLFQQGYVIKSSRPKNVGGGTPNGYGIYDMMGNVWEWCQDWYDKDYYKNSPKNNPVNEIFPKRMRFRVICGGSWRDSDSSFFRCSARGRLNPTTKDTTTGFRCVKIASFGE